MKQIVLPDDTDGFAIFCNTHNIVMYITDEMSCKTRGFTYYDGEEFHVLINCKSSYMQQKKTTIHEIIHIIQNHFSCDESDREKCEREVDEMMKDYRILYESNDFKLGTSY